MLKLTKLVENRKTSYVVELETTLNDYPIFYNVTDIMHDAIRADRKRGYPAENGPAWGIEVQRAIEYAQYVQDCCGQDSRDILYRFDTTQGQFYTDTSRKRVQA